MKPEIKGLYKNQEKDYKKAYDLYVEAFAHYPKLAFAFPEWESRQAAIEMVVAYFLPYDLKFGNIYSLDENINEAIAVAYSEDIDFSRENCEKAGCVNDKFNAAAARLTEEQLNYWWGFFDELDRQESALDLPDRYIYADFVAVRTGMQGEGRGSKIIQALCRFADEEGLPVMLFTNGEEDIKFYLKNGFRQIAVTQSDEFKMKNTYMLYEPR
ncbi:MAG: GNAT family N-acetyltransferase [Firmicutes bacterium]|nr:GNAT family N-acetyltransferase [Bacillota bacterium]